jgi:hypothetical protein
MGSDQIRSCAVSPFIRFAVNKVVVIFKVPVLANDVHDLPLIKRVLNGVVIGVGSFNV